ncbi:hydrogenase maturation protease [Nocardia jiangxiensis]|uniref:hydrogenase maturation protease n=1 Tax=Nocardia jiangxiensis TaxID=282685 RepID=UPI0002D890A4|nr:hydrogenase maturation protease [Nocardia jiangxiensis]
MTLRRAVVAGIGNEYRHDDGIGPRVAEALAGPALPDVPVAVCDGEPTDLMDIWSGVDLAVVVDAALCRPSHPGRIHRTTVESLSSVAATSSHALGLREAITLARLLGRLPGELVVIVVEAARIDPRCRPLAVRGIGRAGGRRHRAGRTAPGPRRPALMSQLTVLERCARRRLERVAGLLSWRVPSYSCPLCVSR